MHGAVPDDSLLRALAAATPDVDALDVATFERLASRDNLGIRRIRSRKISKPLVVVGEGVVRVEPGRVGSRASCLIT